MARPCTICTHPRRTEIDQALVAGITSNTAIATKFDVIETSLRRHRENHLPAKLAQAQEAHEVAQADDLLGQVRSLQERTLVILQTAEQAGELRTALAAIGQARGNLELLARLLGELHDQEVKVAVLVTSPDWLRVRGAILTALDPHPAARQAVVEALRHAG